MNDNDQDTADDKCNKNPGRQKKANSWLKLYIDIYINRYIHIAPIPSTEKQNPSKSYVLRT